MNLGDGIYRAFPDLVTGTGFDRNRVFAVQPYKLAAGYPIPWFMATGSAPAVGDDFPGQKYGSGDPPSGAPATGDWYWWRPDDASATDPLTLWPVSLTLVIEGCSHNGTAITGGTWHYLEQFVGGDSPTHLPETRPYFGVDGVLDLPITRLGLPAAANYLVRTTGLPSLSIDSARLFQAAFWSAPLAGQTNSVVGSPAVGDEEVVLDGFGYLDQGSDDPNLGFSQIVSNRVGDLGFATLTSGFKLVASFGADAVRYELTFDSRTGDEVTFLVSPPFLARTIGSGMAGVDAVWKPRHEIPEGVPFDLKLDLFRYVREKWNAGVLVSTDPAEYLAYDGRLFWSPFE